MSQSRVAVCVSIVCSLGASAAMGTVRYVDDSAPPGGNGLSWATASNNLFATLQGAGPGDEIRVGGGTYKPAPASGRATAYFALRDGMILRGGYVGYAAPDPDQQDPAYLTVLSGDLNGDDGPGFTNRSDNAYHVVKIAANAANNTAQCVVDSFTITGGQADNPNYPESYGGAIHATGGCRIMRCIVRDNHAEYGGGLVAFSKCEASDTLFENNRAHWSGGAIRFPGTGPSGVQTCPFRRCIFRNNLSMAGPGGAVEYMYTYPVFIHCIFTGNVSPQNGGAIKGNYHTLTCINSAFYGNQGSTGGAIWVESGGVLVGCVLSGNTAPGQFGYAGAATGISQMINCTVSGNTAASLGGVQGGYPTIVKNSLLWGNSDNTGSIQAAQLRFDTSYPNNVLAYNSIQGWTGSLGGVANNGLNPRFELPAGQDGVIGTEDDNLRLQPADPTAGSPAIDSGDNASVPADIADLDADNDTAEQLPLDIDGNPRIANDATMLPDADVVNRGAYENDHPAPTITAWRSVRMHGGPAGALSIPLDPAASGNGVTGPTSEPRNGGIREIQVDFSATVQLKSPPAISVLVYPPSGGPPINMSGAAILSMADSDTLRIVFASGLPSPACVTIDVTNSVADMSNNTISGDKTCSLRNLPADLTSSGLINLSDALLARFRLLAGLSAAASPATDFNLNGLLETTDVQQIKSRIFPSPQQAHCP